MQLPVDHESQTQQEENMPAEELRLLTQIGLGVAALSGFVGMWAGVFDMSEKGAQTVQVSFGGLLAGAALIAFSERKTLSSSFRSGTTEQDQA